MCLWAGCGALEGGGAETEVQVCGLGAGMMEFAIDREGRGGEVRPFLGGVGEGWGLGWVRNSVWDVTLEVSFRQAGREFELAAQCKSGIPETGVGKRRTLSYFAV